MVFNRSLHISSALSFDSTSKKNHISSVASATSLYFLSFSNLLFVSANKFVEALFEHHLITATSEKQLFK